VQGLAVILKLDELPDLAVEKIWQFASQFDISYIKEGRACLAVNSSL